MGAQLTNPNFHVALLHFPIGLFTLGMLIEIFSFMYPGGPARRAGRWMVAIGVLSMVPVSLSGVYAFSDVVRRTMPPGDRVDLPWRELTARTQIHDPISEPQGEQWQLLKGHIWRMAPATGIAVLAVVVGIGATGVWRRRLYLPVMALLLFALGVMLWGAWMGGEMVYEHGMGVQLDLRRSVTVAAAPTPATVPSVALEQTESRTPKAASYYVPPAQGHMILAGIAAAFALGALGLAWRNSAGPRPLEVEEEVLATGAPADVAMIRMFKPAAAVATVKEEIVPAARTWLAAALLALAASGMGWWFLASATDAMKVAEGEKRSVIAVLWDRVRAPADAPAAAPRVMPTTAPATQPTETPTAATPTATSTSSATALPLGLTRRLGHVIIGVSIVVLGLILAAMARWAPKRRTVLLVMSVLLVAALAAQVWLGTLMTLDGPAGSPLRFQ